MTTVAFPSVQAAISELRGQHLELAPEGWRECVEKIAEGYAEVVGGHVYCLNCDGVLQGAQGHDIHCVTMVARRMLANEPLLHAHSALAPQDGGKQDHRAKPSWKFGRKAARSHSMPRVRPRGPDLRYVVPTFLDAAPPVPKS